MTPTCEYVSAPHLLSRFYYDNSVRSLPSYDLQAMSGARASTSGRLPTAALTSVETSPGRCFPKGLRPAASARQGIAGGRNTIFSHSCRPPTCRSVSCQAQKTQQESERPVMEQLESDLVAGTSSSNGSDNGSANGVGRNGSKAPSKNSATNIADRIDSKPAEESQDEGDNNDSGAQSHGERSGGIPAKAASKVPGGVTEGDNVSAPKPASFWLPHPEPGDFAPVTIANRLLALCIIIWCSVVTSVFTASPVHDLQGSGFAPCQAC